MPKNLVLRGTVWQFEKVLNGERIRQSTNTTDLEAARKVRDRILRELKDAPPVETDDPLMEALAGSKYPLLSDASEDILKEHYGGDRNCAQFQNLDRLARWNDVRLNQIDKQYLKDMRKWLEEKGSSPETINRYWACLRFLLNYAVDEWEMDLMVPRMKKVKVKNNRRERILSRKDEQKVTHWLRNCERHDKAHYADLVEVLLDTGMRLGEALALTTDHIVGDTIQLTSKMTKTTKPRIVPMTPRVQAIMKRRATGEVIFPFQKWAAARAFKDALTGCRLNPGSTQKDKLVLHCLRHTAATRMLAGGASLYEVSKVLGHSNPNVTTDRYSHYELGAARNGIKALTPEEEEI